VIKTKRQANAWCAKTGAYVVVLSNDPRFVLPKGAFVAACRAIEKLVKAKS